MSKKIILFVVLSLVCMSPSLCSADYRTITVDGSTSDWTGAVSSQHDIAGDGGSSNFDLMDIYLANSADSLFVRLDTYGNIDPSPDFSFYNVWLDTDNNTATGFRGLGGVWALGADSRMYLDKWNMNGLLQPHTGAANSNTWGLSQGMGANYDGQTLEMGAFLSSLNLTAGNNIKIIGAGYNNMYDMIGDPDISPIGYTIDGSPVVPEPMTVITFMSGLAGLIGFAVRKKG